MDGELQATFSCKLSRTSLHVMCHQFVCCAVDNALFSFSETLVKSINK